ncbi:MAG: DNA polymerase III subunit gamma/tau [Planctomycetes bacterium]|nr:DNA polymerase III subunit gamma/tau [Planctomycetota bacterium]
MAKQKAPLAVPAETPAPEGYTVLARRYRPQHFAELVGQEHVARALENALKSNRVAHAYLFTGARGVGKTSTARILAKALNCEHGPTTQPCDECAICKSIASGEDVDVLEIDGASNNGVERVRELRANVQYRPSRARYKIYIIDEVHMLTVAAFNALLKTLEEPPPHVKFIFATTEVQKIPITILSRCQRFDFAGIGTAPIKDRLREIVQNEGMQADDEALDMIARRAGGSMRDAQSLLDQLLAFGSDRLTADQVHALLGTAGDDRVVELATAVLEHDAKRALDLLAALAGRSLQLGELLDQLMAYWRDLMVVRCTGAEAPDLSVPSRHRESLLKQANALGLETILAGLDILNGARARLRNSNHGRLLVEMALVRLARLEDLIPVSQLVQSLAQGISAGTVPAPSAARMVAPPEGLKKKLTAPGENGTHAQPLALTSDSLPEVWQRVLISVGPLFASQLDKCNVPAIFGPNTLVIRFAAGYDKEREFCQAPDRLKKVEEALQKTTGRPWTVRVEAGGSAANAAPTASVVPPREAENSLVRARRQREEAENEPLIKRALEVLGAQLVRVDEGFNTAPAPAPVANRPPIPAPEEVGDGEEA